MCGGVTLHAILVILAELEQHKRRLVSCVNTGKKKKDGGNVKHTERGRESERETAEGAEGSRGEMADPSHDLHGPSTGATWSTNIGKASRGYGNPAVLAIISS